jgi:hypothetical protein
LETQPYYIWHCIILQVARKLRPLEAIPSAYPRGFWTVYWLYRVVAGAVKWIKVHEKRDRSWLWSQVFLGFNSLSDMFIWG